MQHHASHVNEYINYMLLLSLKRFGNYLIILPLINSYNLHVTNDILFGFVQFEGGGGGWGCRGAQTLSLIPLGC